MLKWTIFVISGLTLVWTLLHLQALSLISVAGGVALATTCFMLLIFFKREPVSVPDPSLQNRVADVEARARQKVEALREEMQKLEYKQARAEEKSVSYQKLVHVHQQEIEKQRVEIEALAEQLTQKERKLSELYLLQLEPDLFDPKPRKKRKVTPALESRDLLA